MKIKTKHIVININIKRNLLFCFLLFFAQFVHAQLNRGITLEIIQSNGVKVEMILIPPVNRCGNFPKDWKWRLRSHNTDLLASNQRHLTWKLVTVNCEGYTIKKVFSVDVERIREAEDNPLGDIDWQFLAESVENNVLEARFQQFPSTEKEQNLGKKLSLFPPDSIAGGGQYTSEERVGLTVKGPALPQDAKWVWYKDGCAAGTPVHIGIKYDVYPRKSTTYFVRSESGTEFSECTQVDVMINDESMAAEEISSDDGDDKICEGSSSGKKLQRIGGKLGLRAKWVWYVNDLSPSSKIKVGADEILVNPTRTTTYYLRAEDPSGKYSPEVKFVLKVVGKSKPPLGIKRIPEGEICEGQPIQLAVVGGMLGEGAEWIWNAYRAGGGQQFLGDGNSIDDIPFGNTTYSVYAAGNCFDTDPVSTDVLVNDLSDLPSQWQITFQRAPSKRKYTATINGGKLGKGADWYWYKDVNGESRFATGSSFTSRKLDTTDVFLRAEGGCKNTEFLKVSVPGVGKRRFVFLLAGLVTNDLNLGMQTVKNVFFAAGSNSIFFKASLPMPGLFGETNKEITKPVLESDDTKVLNYPANTGTFYSFNDKTYANVQNYAIGFMLGRRNIRPFMGVGYGSYDLIWGLDTYSYSNNNKVGERWAKNTVRSLSGPCLEAGLFMRLGPISMMGGLNGIYSIEKSTQYISGYLGVGLAF